MRLSTLTGKGTIKLSQLSPDLTTGPNAPLNHPENILQRISGLINPNQVAYEMTGGTAPSDIGMGLGMAATGHPFSQGLNPAAKAEGMRTEGINSITQNPFLRAILDILTNPMTYVGGGVLGTKAIKETPNVLNQGAKLATLGKVDFGGANATRNLASDIQSSIKKGFEAFNPRYEKILEKASDKAVPEELKNSILEPMVSRADEIVPGSAGEKYINKLMDRIGDSSAKQLHGMKQEIFDKVKSFGGAEGSILKDTYRKIGDVLGHDDVFGQAYRDVTSDFKTFTQNAKYGKRLTLDPMGNPTESKLLTRGNISLNEQDALNALGEESGNPFVSKINALRRGETLKKNVEKINPLSKQFFKFI